MKIEKVNENQIRCTLTREDLASRELKISELAYGTEKAKTLFRDMMQQANFEFGFEAEDIPLMIEAIPLNAECIVLIITKVEDPEELDTRFSRFAPSVTEDDDGEEGIYESPSDEMLDLFRKLQTNRKTVGDGKAAQTASEQDDMNRTHIFLIDSLKQAMTAARMICSHYTGESTLYKDEHTGKYLFMLTQGSASREVFDRACNVGSEYGSLQRSLSGSRTFLAEHYDPLVEKDAVGALGQI